jgi:CheY-like chemotaxis protein
MITEQETFNILVIEDELSEQKLIKMLIKNSGYNIKLKFINDGEEATKFISSFANNESINEKIDLIFLDLNLPKINGIVVLKTLKNNYHLKSIPVLVLTTSNNQSDINLAYIEGASGYIRKPAVFEEYEKKIEVILNYWLNICILP